MLESFVFSMNATLPVFFVILVGMLLSKLGLFPKSFCENVDKYVFKVALPVMLFRDISAMDFRKEFDLYFVLVCAVITVVMFLLVWLGAALLLKDKTMVGAFAQGASRGSAAILGIALATNIYGTPGYAPLMIFSAVILFNILSVVILSFGSSDKKKGKIDFAVLVKSIVTNPIILGIVVAIPFSLLKITFPQVIMKTFDSISSTATPMALLSIGASFSLAEAGKKIKPALAASFIKLFALPCIFLPVAIQLGFRDSALVAIFIMLGSPTTVTCYIMSKNMNNDSVLSSNIIMLSTLFSMISVPLFVFIMKYFSLI